GPQGGQLSTGRGGAGVVPGLGGAASTTEEDRLGRLLVVLLLVPAVGNVPGAEQARLLPAVELLERGGVGASVVVEGVLAAPLGDDPVQVDVDDRGAHPRREPLGLPQQVTALVHEGLPVPGEIRRGLALAGGGVDVGGLAAGGGGAGHERAVLGAADRDRGARQVRDHGGAGERG